MVAEQWLSDSRTVVDGWIRDDIAAMEALPGSVEEVMAYALTAGGKRLRPQLMLAAAEYVSVDWEALRPAVLAVEYLHTYSLIHDDLPAMDDDELRRGKPTAHIAFGEAQAILAGDALLTEAFFKMAALSPGFAPERVIRASRRLALAAGREGLVRGQVLDLAAEYQTVDVQQLERIHRLKTGALFSAALSLPAILAGDREAEELLSAFGEHFGLAFQMVDDMLNVIGDAQTLGKATGTDANRGKATYPRLMGLEAVRQLVDEHCRAALALVDPERGEHLAALLAFARDRSW
ncbi:polyprenyl synthetase family protein [Sulfobacillus harzensis]|uniref:Farnesyl diphosphate synthase n=1 Tax=Sulfobacillus harzensis TaxID=2729629 RepID=A0A7Y0L0R2_9FIRM|nr:farnesyl diphosphate synthase [Sulfobacillus harzensis]NMP21147.1 polyprenyl synthetase family protein [Sulfobacillus harzensis]